MRRSLLLVSLLVLLVTFASGCTPTEEGWVAHFAFEGNLEDSTGRFAGGELVGTRIGTNVGEITQTRGEEHYSVSYGEGVKGQAIKFDGNQGVLLPSGLIEGYTYTISLWIKPEVLTMHTTTFFGGASDTSWISVVPSGWSSGHTMIPVIYNGMMLYVERPFRLTNGLMLLLPLTTGMSQYILMAWRSLPEPDSRMYSASLKQMECLYWLSTGGIHRSSGCWMN